MDSDKLIASLAASDNHLPSLLCTASCATRRSLRALGAAGEAADWASCAASEGCREGAARDDKNGYWPGYDVCTCVGATFLVHIVALWTMHV